MTGPRVRAAVPEDYERLRELTIESKAHWGYDRELVQRWGDGLSFEGGRERWVAEEDGEIVAWAALAPPRGDVAVLDDLWVGPEWMRHGLGTRLFDVAAARARELGALRLEWEADPNAAGFYEQVGGRVLGYCVTAWGRVVPWMGLEL
jgi:N-acetylglutamate synthase-like GNAT family acetyltransferase